MATHRAALTAPSEKRIETRPALGHRPHRPAPRTAPLRRERGVALVEFAFVALLLTGIIFTTIDYGRFAQLQNRLSNAAREGSAHAQLQPCDADGITQRVRGQDESLGDVLVTVTYRDGSGTGASSACDADPGKRVIVEVSAQLTMFSPLAAAAVGEDVTVTRRAEAVIQG